MMFPSEVGVEVRIRDPPMIPLVPFGAFALPLLRPSFLMPVLFPPLLLFPVLPLLLLLHLATVLRLLRMPVTALRLLPSFALRSHLPAISTLRLLIGTVFIAMIFGPRLLLRSSLLLPALRSHFVLRFILMLVLRDGRERRTQQQRSANPTH